MTLRAIALGAFGLCVASLAYVFTSVRDPAPATVVPLAGERAAPSVSVASAPRMSAPRAPVDIRPPEAAWSAQDPPAVVAQRWQEAADKRDFYERALATGGGAYLHFAGKALAQCGAVNRLGVIGAEQRFGSTHRANDPSLPRRIEAFRASIAGCDGFEAHAVGGDEENTIYQRLLAAGDLVGRIYAYKLWALSAARSDEARATLVQALDSRDPELLALVYPAVVAREFAARVGEAKAPTDMQDELDAWRWALCDLGADCGPASAYGRSLCVGRGLCDWGTIDEVAEKVFPGATSERKHAIVAGVLARDWSKLGL
jgi:hypothetical protein